MLDCVLKSGSLKLRIWVEPEARADLTAASQTEVKELSRPQSIGTYSKLPGTVPLGVEAQL
jgi:hypothetical protein